MKFMLSPAEFQFMGGGAENCYDRELKLCVCVCRKKELKPRFYDY